MNAGIDVKISTAHRAKQAVVYVRQSSPSQLVRNTGSTLSQYDLVKHVARLGWPPDLIRVMDQDQGKSAASAEHRVGFQELVAEVALGHIGLVCSLEVSRLARNNSDWYQLLDLCAVRRTLIADPEGVYDPAMFNDRLLLGLRGTMSEAELHLLRARLDGGRLAKAQRGELCLRLPTGLIYNDEGEVVLDPDAQIQSAVGLVFERFRVLRSARAVVRHLRGKAIRLPSRQWAGGEAGRVEWREAEYGHVVRLLHNPRLAGTYAYGQRRTEPRVLTGGREVRHRLGPDEWRVVIPDAHPGYISWEEFLSNQERLAANSFAKGSSGVKRKGATLLQGLAVCGRCGRPMGVAYSGTGGKYPLYKCWHGRTRMAQAPCQAVYAGYVDLAVAEAFLEAINPDAIELALAAFELADQEAHQVEQQWEMELDRAHYEAERAFRQYNKVEPENRLVARTLEARWEEALRAVQQLERQQASAK